MKLFSICACSSGGVILKFFFYIYKLALLAILICGMETFDKFWSGPYEKHLGNYYFEIKPGVQENLPAVHAS